ncbi:alpha/beta fold hydrolase [Hyphomonas sp.]|uniref:alpha/beta fold hydrolase n=1 Tax=Hyphomonas sp. TaxID=87 RepID=UPI00391A94C9
MKVWTILFGTLAAAALLGGCWLYTPDKPRAELERKYLRQPADMMTVAGISLHVRDDGPAGAPALILVHGFGSSLHTYEPWAEALKEDYRVIRFDLPGSGLSPPDPTGNYTDARSQMLILALMDQLDLPKAALIGNSIGGRIAWGFAADHPERVDKLVLISPDGFASPGFAYGKPADVPQVMQAMRFALPKSAIRPNLTASYGNPSRLSETAVTRYHDLMLAPGGRTALLKRMEQTVLTDPAERLPAIKAPVLLMWGKKDRLIPFSNSADYARLLPGSRLVAFKDLGHVPMEEDPQQSLAPLRDFLAE